MNNDDKDITSTDVILYLSRMVAKLSEENEKLRVAATASTITPQAFQALNDELYACKSELSTTKIDLKFERETFEERGRMVRDLEIRLQTYLRADPELHQKADFFMNGEGRSLDKVSAIKKVREMTDWGLKFAKDFVEEWLTENKKVHFKPGDQVCCIDPAFGLGKEAFTIRDILQNVERIVLVDYPNLTFPASGFVLASDNKCSIPPHKEEDDDYEEGDDYDYEDDDFRGLP